MHLWNQGQAVVGCCVRIGPEQDGERWRGAALPPAASTADDLSQCVAAAGHSKPKFLCNSTAHRKRSLNTQLGHGEVVLADLAATTLPFVFCLLRTIMQWHVSILGLPVHMVLYATEDILGILAICLPVLGAILFELPH